MGRNAHFSKTIIQKLPFVGQLASQLTFQLAWAGNSPWDPTLWTVHQRKKQLSWSDQCMSVQLAKRRHRLEPENDRQPNNSRVSGGWHIQNQRQHPKTHEGPNTDGRPADPPSVLATTATLPHTALCHLLPLRVSIPNQVIQTGVPKLRSVPQLATSRQHEARAWQPVPLARMDWNFLLSFLWHDPSQRMR